MSKNKVTFGNSVCKLPRKDTSIKTACYTLFWEHCVFFDQDGKVCGPSAKKLIKLKY